MMRTLCATITTLALTFSGALAQDTAPVSMDVETAPDLDGTISIPADAKRVAPRVAAARSITKAAFEAGFSGEVVVDMGGLLMINAVSPDLARQGYGEIDGERLLWPYASVTKQVLAAKLVAELDAGGYSLDTPISEFVEGFGGSQAPVPTVRQLLQHRSGLRNSDQTPKGANTWPDFYNNPGEYGLDWCLEDRAVPPAEGWSYNNCDYIVLGAAFDELSFEDWQYLLGSEEETNSAPFVITARNVDRFYGMTGPERDTIPAYGAAAALGGTLEALTFQNWERMQSYKEDIAAGGARAAFWQGDPMLGYMALGHWVFDVEHPSCEAPIKVSQRKGGIGRYQLENIMLPELGRSMVFATAKAGFEFGEIWMRQGVLYDAVGALACGDKS